MNHSYDSVFELKLQRLFAFEFSGPRPSAAYFLRRSGLALRIFERNAESVVVISFARGGAGDAGPAQPSSANPFNRSFARRLVSCFAPELFFPLGNQIGVALSATGKRERTFTMANQPTETREALNRCRHLISRVGRPADVAETRTFLLSDKSP